MINQQVRTIEKHSDVPAGSVFVVDNETPTHVLGYWASPYGTWYIAVPKSKIELVEGS